MAIRYLRFAVRGSRFAICYPLFAILALFMIANWCFPLPKAQLHRSSSPIVLDRNGEWLRAFLAPDGMWRFSPVQSSMVIQLMVPREGYFEGQARLTNNNNNNQQPTRQLLSTSSNANVGGQVVLLPLWH